MPPKKQWYGFAKTRVANQVHIDCHVSYAHSRKLDALALELNVSKKYVTMALLEAALDKIPDPELTSPWKLLNES